METVVDLSKLRCNIRRIRGMTRNKFCAVVKSDAYGHGCAVAPYIENIVDCFFVADYDEAQAIKLIGVKCPVLVLGGDIKPFLSSDDSSIIPTVSSSAELKALLGSGRTSFSVAVNTGMNRLGANELELNRIISLCRTYSVAPQSVYSHLYDGVNSAAEQREKFDRLTDDAILMKNRHLFASNALDMNTPDLYDMTRCGIAMYGYHDGFECCMYVRAKIAAIKRVTKGEHIGYGTYTAPRDMIVASVKCGYSDGFRRCGKQTYMRVRGERCDVLGIPCMDITMIDVTNVPCRVGEYAYIIAQKSDAEYLAECYNTIVYEVLTGFNGRAKRIYM